ncbi:hypothetical protein N7931_19265 [Catenovulum sp. 2E275]|uniref:hypothetical protein n=1 Tax=Catenovulum sp. 2E275 TaxID=2980497 RepID=UPI0021CED0E0|nr:hypothetical protein [Catenovulum sp. 2E275]MCU4677752.1 hypothetical protein [Catenovulum sp. 2E275]
MKIVILALLFPTLAMSAEILETPNYKVSIQSNCQEGEVGCSNYVYEGQSKKSGNSISLKGSSWHTTCNDGETPCRFLGYKFKNGNIMYYVHQDGLLEVVTNKNEVILSEQGVWQ